MSTSLKILISSHRFCPSVGGIETVGRLLAEEFTNLGHTVRVVTRTKAASSDSHSYQVLRRPGCMELGRQMRWADLCLHNNISLQTAWPFLFARKPWVVIHHTWIQRPDGTLGPRDYLKRFLLRFASSVAISEAIAQSLPCPAVRIPDPYDDQLFKPEPHLERDRDLVMVGRLVSDKGADVLVRALALLRSHALRPNLTLVGDGPERPALEQLARELRVENQIHFAGEQTGSTLARLLNRHRILVVPSRWREPFGLVALEGMACGCVVVGSAGGGLKEAIGSAGLTFLNNQIAPLADLLATLLQNPDVLDHYRARAASHLQRHARRVVAEMYVNHFQWCLSRFSSRDGRHLASRIR